MKLPPLKSHHDHGGRPPMGFMSWEQFQCNPNCGDPEAPTCVSEKLYTTIAD